MVAEIKLSFPPTIEPVVGVREINNLKIRLLAALPNCKVDIAKNVAGLEYSDTYKGETGADTQKNTPQQYYAELEITGTL
jgi:hypothetical protein